MRKGLIAIATLALLFGSGSLALAIGSTDSRANQPQVASDPSSNTTARFPTNKQNEPTIAVDPVNGKLIAGSNDEQVEPPCGPGPVRGSTAPANDCSFFPGVSTSGVYTSNDGTSWTNRGLLPGYSNTGGSLVSDGDPVIVFGPKPTSSGVFTFFGEPIMVAFSADGGATWSAPNQLSAAHNNGTVGGRQGSTVRTGPDGTVYVFWEDGDNKVGNKMVFASSSDGGVHWTRPADIAPVRDIADPIPGANFRTDSFLSAGVDQRNGAVYAAWAHRTGGAGHIVVTQSADKGATWGAPRTGSATANRCALFQGP